MTALSFCKQATINLTPMTDIMAAQLATEVAIELQVSIGRQTLLN